MMNGFNDDGWAGDCLTEVELIELIEMNDIRIEKNGMEFETDCPPEIIFQLDHHVFAHKRLEEWIEQLQKHLISTS